MQIRECSWIIAGKDSEQACQALTSASPESPVLLQHPQDSQTLPLLLKVVVPVASQDEAGQIQIVSSARTIELSVLESGQYAYIGSYRADKRTPSFQANLHTVTVPIPIPAAKSIASSTLQLKLLSIQPDKLQCTITSLSYILTVTDKPSTIGSDSTADDTATSGAVQDHQQLSQTAQVRLLLQHAVQQQTEPGSGTVALPDSLQALADKMLAASKVAKGLPIADSDNQQQAGVVGSHKMAASIAGLVASEVLKKADDASEAHGPGRGFPNSIQGLTNTIDPLSVVSMLQRLDTHMTSMEQLVRRVESMEQCMQKIAHVVGSIDTRLAAVESMLIKADTSERTVKGSDGCAFELRVLIWQLSKDHRGWKPGLHHLHFEPRAVRQCDLYFMTFRRLGSIY